MLAEYSAHEKERAAGGLPPRALDAQQTAQLVESLKSPPASSADQLLALLARQVPPGVDEAAYVKAAFLADIARNLASSPVLEPRQAVELLGGMLGGYNVAPLIDLLDHPELANVAANALKHTLLVFDAFHDVAEKAQKGNRHAQSVIQSWADAEWFERCDPVPEKLALAVFKVPGETNTDELSPAQDAWSRPDIPLHALSMLKNGHLGVADEPLRVIDQLKNTGHRVAFVGDVVGTGSSRKSAANSLLWHIGEDSPGVPNKRQGGVVLAEKIAPIFFNTIEDAGALPIECEVDGMSTGDIVVVRPYDGVVESDRGATIARFELAHNRLLDQVRAGGRIPLIVGRGLTARARDLLGLGPSESFQIPEPIGSETGGFTLAQKIVGRACGLPGVRQGTYCEPRVSTVGSQDTTGPMTRDELKSWRASGFPPISYCKRFATPPRIQSPSISKPNTPCRTS